MRRATGVVTAREQCADSRPVQLFSPVPPPERSPSCTLERRPGASVRGRQQGHQEQCL